VTEARFLSNNSVTCEANQVKYETLIQDSWAYKKPLKILEVDQGVHPCEASLFQKVEIFDISGPHSHPYAD